MIAASRPWARTLFGSLAMIVATGTFYSPPTSAQDTEGPVTIVTYRIDGMVCQGCADEVQSVIRALDGVRSAEVSLEQRAARVVWEGNAHDSALIQAVRQAGFRARRVQEPEGSG